MKDKVIHIYYINKIKDLEKVEKEAYSKLVKETHAYVKEHHRYNSKEDYSLAHTKTVFELTAEEMNKLGWIKLAEDSVVLSREEYEILVKTAQGKIGNMKATDFLKACISSGVMVEVVSTEEQVKQAYEKGSKETAEKFANEVKAYIYDNDYLIDVINKTLKQFGVEIKE